MSALLALGGAAALVTACERRVEEPTPEVRPLHPPAFSSAASQKADPTVEPPKPPPARAQGRCVKPTPAAAARPTPKSPDPACPKDPETPPKLRNAKVVFTEAKGDAVTVEVAENDHDRQRGLMYRKSMPQDHGMIFNFAVTENHAFWMHNTCIPLDMLFIAEDGLIVGIEENTPTMSDDTFEVGCPSKYVLELNAGWTRAHGVTAGQRVKLEGL